MSSFYITLPSNTGVDTSQLSTSNFTVRLPTTLDLSEGEWTVALSSIIYPVTFHSEEEEMLIIITYIDGKRKILKIPGKAFDSVLQMESIINEAIFGEKIEKTTDEIIREKRTIPSEEAKKVSSKTVEEPAEDTEKDEEPDKEKSKRQATTRTAEQMLASAVNEIKKSSNEKLKLYLADIKDVIWRFNQKVNNGLEMSTNLKKIMYPYRGLTWDRIVQLDLDLDKINRDYSSLKGSIADLDKRVDEINYEYQQILGDIDAIYDRKDVKSARDLANKAKSLVAELKKKLEETLGEHEKKLNNYESLLQEIDLIISDLVAPVPESELENFKRIMAVIASKFKARDKITHEIIEGQENKKDMSELDVYLYYDRVTGRFFLFNNKPKEIVGVQMSKSLAFRLGFETDKNYHLKNIHLSQGGGFAKYVPYTGKGVPQFFVYMPDIIEESFVGDVMAPVLRVINVDKPPGVYAENIYTLEYHHKIIQKRISSIKIQLRDLSGEFLKFDWGDVIIILHFKKNYYI